jgi:hypothetical protein
MATLSAIREAIAARRWLWLLITLGFFVAYYAGLVLSVVARFGDLPNYATLHDYVHNVVVIVRSTPAVRDMVPIIFDEWLLEIGFINYDYGHGIAEWSIQIIPAKSFVVLMVGALVATNLVLLAGFAPRCGRAVRYCGVVATGIGATIVGFTSVTMMWVVCCAAPTWAVALALLGVGVSTAFGIQPFGAAIAVAGFAVLLGATYLLAHGRATASEQDVVTTPRLAPHNV